MTLIERSNFPPKGYLYYEPALDWPKVSTTEGRSLQRELAMQGMRAVAEALQRVRAQNPQAGLDPSYEACVQAIGEFTCARLVGTKAFAEFCGGEPATEQERAQVKAARARAAKVGGCAGCGRR